ncbi:hypothetical protein L2E82_31190 [Cichorium intybus]|uniref:Uncharacterized protein n=1 Tax=Cichorium intybus TaxID=13427 RepID=A0ACB9D2C9_CICIN|nr:hypothetical protein L2E82_31190 [Cichorium intybus]
MDVERRHGKFKPVIKKALVELERSGLRYSILNSQSQFLTHIIGRILSEMKVTHTPIDIKGFEKLLQVVCMFNLRYIIASLSLLVKERSIKVYSYLATFFCFH